MDIAGRRNDSRVEPLGVTLQGINQQIGKNLRVLRAHVNPSMDSPFFLPELKQKFGRIVSNLEEISVASFLLAMSRSRGKIFLLYASHKCVISPACSLVLGTQLLLAFAAA
jgi:hypothetical protein